MLPNVNITVNNNGLGKVETPTDGVAGLILSGVASAGVTLNTKLGPYSSLADAEADGITESFDSTNSVLCWNHIKEFYEEAGNGKKLYVMVVANTLRLTDICDDSNTYLKKLLTDAEGEIKIVGITMTPDVAYTPTYAGQLESDLGTAITALKTLLANEALAYRPVRALIEARNFQGTVSSLTDARTLAANRIAQVIGHTNYLHGKTNGNKAASVGCVLGRLAKIPVQRNIGRVKDGALSGVSIAYLSNGNAISTYSDTNQNTLNDLGYVFMRKHMGKDGYYFNDDPTSVAVTDDFSQFSIGRTIDKISRITKRVYTDELLDELSVDQSTGKLAISTVKHFEGLVESAVNAEMTVNEEITSIKAFVDPDQDVISLSEIKIEVKPVIKATGRQISVTIGLTNPFNS